MNKQNSFKHFYESLTSQEKGQLAERAGTHPVYLWQLAKGKRRAGASLIERLMAADNRITFQMMRAPIDDVA
jgi:hypothetical protein